MGAPENLHGAMGAPWGSLGAHGSPLGAHEVYEAPQRPIGAHGAPLKTHGWPIGGLFPSFRVFLYVSSNLQGPPMARGPVNF